jgi:hypothetical protein
MPVKRFSRKPLLFSAPSRVISESDVIVYRASCDLLVLETKFNKLTLNHHVNLCTNSAPSCQRKPYA